MNNCFLQNHLNNINNNFQNLKKKRYSVAYGGYLRKQNSLMKINKKPIKNKKDNKFISISEKNLNNYFSQNSIKKSILKDNYLLPNISAKRNTNILKLTTDSLINKVSNKNLRTIGKSLIKTSKFFSEKNVRISNINNNEKVKSTNVLNTHNLGLFSDFSSQKKNNSNNIFSVFQKISTFKIKKRSNSLKNSLNNIYNLKLIYKIELLNKIKKYKTEIYSTKFGKEDNFKNRLFQKTLFEVSQIQNNLRDELFGDSSDNDSNDKSKSLQETNTKKSSEIKINPEYFRVLKRKNLVYDSLIDDGEDEDNKALLEGKYYISPNSIFKHILDFLLFLCVFYDNFIHSFLFAFTNKQVFAISKIELILNLILEIIYILDFISGFFLAYYQDENLITNINLLIHHYYKSYLINDFLQAIPFETIFIFKFRNKSLYYISYNNPYNKYMYLTLIRKFKFIKFFSKDFHNSFIGFLSNGPSSL